MQVKVNSKQQMHQFGQSLGKLLMGGEVIELVGDVGAGKTTFTQGLATGLAVNEPVQSPTFSISRVYSARDDLELRHYDFYRLSDAGIMAEELSESISLERTVVVIEWAGLVETVLSKDRLQLSIEPIGENSRLVTINSKGPISDRLMEKLE